MVLRAFSILDALGADLQPSPLVPVGNVARFKLVARNMASSTQGLFQLRFVPDAARNIQTY
jgi:hypothetical protein